MSKIALFELEDWEKNFLKKNLKGQTLLFFEGVLKPEHLAKIKDVDALVVFINSEIDKNIISKLPKLKYIATTSSFI